MSQMDSTSLSSGVAAIKPQYVIDKVRQLDLNFVASKDKKRLADENQVEDSNPAPKKKLKGQNKHRPRTTKTPKSEKLCFKIGTEGSCPFGSSCCYSHDVAQYMANKPPDIKDSCYIFQKFGKCPYSFSCRFGSEHLNEQENVVNNEKWSLFKDKPQFANLLTKDVQISLRKRTYNFKKAETALQSFNKILNDRKVFNLQSENSCKNENNKTNSNKNGVKEELPIEKIMKTTIKNESNYASSQLNENNVNTSETALFRKEDNKIECEVPIEKQEEEECSNKKAVEIEIETNSSEAALFEKEVQKINFQDKLYLAPLTTVGNLPFRRICKEFGADITCSEMTLALSLLQGQPSEWALIKRHHTEDVFGIQICGAHPDIMTKCCQVLSDQASFDFVDLNLGCPLDALYKIGAGSGLMNRMKKLEGIVYGVSSVLSVPLTIKMRTGIYGGENIAHSVISKLKDWKTSVSLITLHGRSREQRYTKSADWDYINECNKAASPIPLFGNGDILSYEDYNLRRESTGVSGAMIARGALIKPWIFKEIKSQTHWDISSSERFEILKNFTNYGLEHWGSDSEGVEKTRRFLLEFLSFLYRYIPVGLLERPPQRINERPPLYIGRNDLETLMASPSCSDWIKISEMLLGPVPESFIFLPKHKANAYR